MTDQLERLKAALSDRYVIEREIGTGGMVGNRQRGGVRGRNS